MTLETPLFDKLSEYRQEHGLPIIEIGEMAKEITDKYILSKWYLEVSGGVGQLNELFQYKKYNNKSISVKYCRYPIKYLDMKELFETGLEDWAEAGLRQNEDGALLVLIKQS